MSWPTEKLGNLINIQNGYAFKSAEYADDGYFLMRITNVQKGYISNNNPKYVSIADSSKLSQFILNEGDILMSLTGDVGRVGIINKNNLPAALNQRVARIDIKSEKNLDKKYLFWFLNSDNTRRKIENLGYGVAQINVSTKEIELIDMPLPPLAEQKRIAAILDKSEEIKCRRELAITKLSDLTNSTFVEMFGGSDKFEAKKLAEVCELITDGTHYTPTYVDNGVIFLSAKNVTSGAIDWENIKHIPHDLHCELEKRVSPRLGDVLLAKNGTTGVAAMVDRNITFDIYVSLALLRPSNLVLTEYLHAALNSSVTKRQFNAALKGIGVPNLHLVDIRNALIPLPPVEVQKDFVEKIESIGRLRNKLIGGLVSIKQLMHSLQNQAFTTGFNA